MKTLIACFVGSFALFLSHIVPAAGAGAPGSVEYQVVTEGTRVLPARSGDGDLLKVLVEAANLGGDEVEIAEITFPPNHHVKGHPHGSIEIFYVLSGQLTHVVDGRGAPLTPGMVGIVRPGELVEHINETGEATKALVIWVPGGEIERSFGGAEMKPIAPMSVQEYLPAE